MAETAAGFPWHTQAENRPFHTLSEKTGDPSGAASEPSDRIVDTTNSKSSPTKPVAEKQKLNGKSGKRKGSVRISAPVKLTVVPPVGQRVITEPSRHYNVRTIPPWVRDADEDDLIAAIDDEFIDSPHAALVAQHNSSPSTTQRHNGGSRGGYPTSSGGVRDEKTSRWVSFARSSAYPRENFHGEKVDVEWLNENFTDYSKPWLADHDENDPDDGSGRYRAFQKKHQGWYKRAQFTILRNPFIPLAFRFTIFVFAATAIGLGASIYHLAGDVRLCLNQPPTARSLYCISLIGTEQVNYYRDRSALMAVVVDVISIVYTVYITYDEYFSKPLGLRPARAKVRLVLLDLIFIVFQAANVALAFESLTVDEGACAVGAEPDTSFRFDRICHRAEALSGILTVSLFAWLSTFSVSVLRLVERINAR